MKEEHQLLYDYKQKVREAILKHNECNEYHKVKIDGKIMELTCLDMVLKELGL